MSDEDEQKLKNIEEKRKEIENSKEYLEEKKKDEEKKKREEKEKQLESFIIDYENQAEEIDHALGSLTINGSRVRYFGVMVQQRIEVMNKGKSYTSIQTVPAIITETGLIISERTKPEKTNFKFDTKMTLKKNRWNFKEFLIMPQNITYKDTFEFLKKIYQNNMVFEDPIDYEFNPLWDMITYHQDLLDKEITDLPINALPQ